MTEIELREQTGQFIEICHRDIRRDGIEKLLGWIDKTDFYKVPASTKYHGAYEGGLCQHSLDVLSQAVPLANAYGIEASIESLTICSLFHDVCKANFYKEEMRNQKVNGEWVQVPFYTVEEKFPYGGHGSKSVFLIERFMKLTLEEAVAINCHMGFSDAGNAAMNIGRAYEKYPLAWIIHVADEAATYLLKR